MEKKKDLDLIVKNAQIYTLYRNSRVLVRGSAAVRGDRIVMIEPARKDNDPASA